MTNSQLSLLPSAIATKEMRVITLWQPWASLVALKLKQYETRSWGTDYRGKLAIHAAKRPVKQDELAAIAYSSIGHLEYEALTEIDYPLGCVVAIADLDGCYQMRVGRGVTFANYEPPHYTVGESGIHIGSQPPLEIAVGDWKPGRYAWKLEDVIALNQPIPHVGGQGLRYAPDELIQRIEEAK